MSLNKLLQGYPLRETWIVLSVHWFVNAVQAALTSQLSETLFSVVFAVGFSVLSLKTPWVRNRSLRVFWIVVALVVIGLRLYAALI
jgi:uncharacterized membrane protein YagU involved in acid resistance